jgi:hypothetical protein
MAIGEQEQETGTGNKWFVILSEEKEIYEGFFELFIRALKNAELDGEKLRVTVQRITS